jgi:hypothetical protein
MSSCRGIIIVGKTNTARTQMAEAILRHMTRGRAFVVSAGVHHTHAVHPLIRPCLEEVGVTCFDVGCSSKSVTAVNGDAGYGGSGTYDAGVAIVDEVISPGRKCVSDSARRLRAAQLDALQVRRKGVGAGDAKESEIQEQLEEAERAFEADLLNPAPLPTWQVTNSSATIKRDWRLYTVINSTNASELSPNAFQDEYRGEPLWMEMESDLRLVRQCPVYQTWSIPPVRERLPMEREWQQLQRFRLARTALIEKCHSLLQLLDRRSGAGSESPDRLLVDPITVHPEIHHEAQSSTPTILRQ